MNIDKAIQSALKYHQDGNLQQAAKICKKILIKKPHNFEALHLLGVICYEFKNYDSAVQYFKKALKINPMDAYAYYNLGVALHEPAKLDEAILNYQKALQLRPNFVDAHYYLGVALKMQGKLSEAVASFDTALSYDPCYIKALWARCMSRLLIIYPDESSIHISRRRYQDELMKLREIISREIPQDIEAAAEAVDNQKPFYLPYQGFNDRELQQVYSNLVYKIMALKYPQFSSRPSMPHCLPGEPLRVGMVSGYFYHHSNWKIPIQGWIENIDKKRFRLYGYYTGKENDHSTEIARQYFSRFVEGIAPFEDLCQMIRNDNLHVLIYPEIGMDQMTVKLAALRLAPVQCASWGHPETSGFPTIDYYLSSNLMEPPDADNHYSEQLIRLPNLSIHYTPVHIPSPILNRDTFGLSQKTILYLCCQSLFKYLPQYDEVYPLIARQVGDCQFLFISHPNIRITEEFRFRITQAFKRFGLNGDEFIVFLPSMEQEQYMAINCLSDIYLDSIGWSGCNSTLEALACNLPIVTLPGELMRGRHSSAILTMMGITETIAHTIDDYIALAIRLGQDAEWRHQISGKIAENKHLVYQDTACITALEDFLERVVKERL